MKLVIIKPQEDINPLIKLIKEGGIVAFPTETVYGLGTNALNKESVERIYRVKEREKEKALSLHIGTLKGLEEIVEITPFEWKIILQFFPGPINIILKKKSSIPWWIGKEETIGVRYPSLKITQELLRGVGIPIVATSANMSGGPEARTAQDVIEMIGDRIDGILDGGPVPIGKPSTVVNISRKNIEILREGPIDRKIIEDIIKKILI
ncbi:MAG: L-threonylcarbamoyladenylate synthase [bacterium]